MGQYAKYSSFEFRCSRCKEFNLCLLCTSANHKAGSCPGQKINFHVHVNFVVQKATLALSAKSLLIIKALLFLRVV